MEVTSSPASVPTPWLKLSSNRPDRRQSRRWYRRLAVLHRAHSAVASRGCCRDHGIHGIKQGVMRGISFVAHQGFTIHKNRFVLRQEDEVPAQYVLIRPSA